MRVREVQYNMAVDELEQELHNGFITVKQYNQYMRELDEDFADLWGGSEGAY